MKICEHLTFVQEAFYCIRQESVERFIALNWEIYNSYSYANDKKHCFQF